MSDALERCLRSVARAFLAALALDAVDGRCISSRDALLTYLRYDMAPLSREHFRVLYMDGSNNLVADRVLWTGTVDAVQCHAREIIKVALAFGATGLILVHNHPTGSAAPSVEDGNMTRGIIRACSAVGVVVHDHIVVGRDGAYSMQAAGDMAC